MALVFAPGALRGSGESIAATPDLTAAVLAPTTDVAATIVLAREQDIEKPVLAAALLTALVAPAAGLAIHRVGMAAASRVRRPRVVLNHPRRGPPAFVV